MRSEETVPIFPFSRLLLVTGCLVVAFGLALLALEIAVCIFSFQLFQLERHLADYHYQLQVFATTSVALAILAGVFSIIPTRVVREETRKKALLASAVLAVLAGVALSIAGGMSMPLVVWSRASSRHGLLNEDTPKEEDREFWKTIALFGELLLLVGTVVCAVISVLAFRRISRDRNLTINSAKYLLGPRASTAYQDARVERMITDL